MADRLPNYLLVVADDLLQIGVDRQKRGEPRSAMLTELLEGSIADPTLVALRRAFSLTFPDSSSPDAAKTAIKEIHRICAGALRPLTKVLRGLKLKPLHDTSLEPKKASQIFKYFFCSRTLLASLVSAEKSKQTQMESVLGTPADDLVFCLFQLFSMTFPQDRKADDQTRTLIYIRQLISAILPSLNHLLDEIEIEPIAVPLRPFMDALEGSDDEGK